MKIKSVSEIKDKNKFKQFFKRFWWIVWRDDSFKGWIISLLFIFVVIKFIFFPLLNLITGTTLPLAIVESCSMYHKGNMFNNFDDWWLNHEDKYSKFQITMNTFEESIFHKGFSKGDILFIVRADPEKLKVGDVIIFNGGQANPIIHRVVKITRSPATGKLVFSTIGDNNNGQLPIELNISEDQIVGKPVARIAPSIGWGKLIFYEYKKSPSERGFCDER